MYEFTYELKEYHMMQKRVRFTMQYENKIPLLVAE